MKDHEETYEKAIPKANGTGVKIRATRSRIELIPQASIGKRDPRTFEIISAATFDETRAVAAEISDKTRDMIRCVLSGGCAGMSDPLSGIELEHEYDPVDYYRLQVADRYVILSEQQVDTFRTLFAEAEGGAE